MRQSEREWSVFQERFKKSRAAVFKVAEYIWREKGLGVTIPAMILAPDVSKSVDYIDKGDIICHADNGKNYIVEVKQNSINFTCSDDFPFKSILVNEVEKADRLDAFVYFMVNQNLTHAFMLKTNTKHMWDKKDVPDKQRGDVTPTYVCDLNLGEFIIL